MSSQDRPSEPVKAYGVTRPFPWPADVEIGASSAEASL
jgi:hypothetical protein